MNVAKISNRWLNRLYKTLAIMLVLIAVFTSSLRLLLPYVENYKNHLENYINTNNNTHIAIGQLAMSWRDLGPVLIVKNVQLLDTEEADIFIEELEVQVDFWKSLTLQKLISERLVIKGAKISIDEGLWKPIPDADKASTENENSQPKIVNNQVEIKENFAFTQIGNLFLNRIASFSIFDSEINIGYEKERNFKIVHVRWNNEGDIHKAQGHVVFDDLSDTKVKVSINVKGESASDLNGEVYLHANGLDITPWLDRFLAVDNDKSSSSISFDAWGRIRGSEVDRLQVELYDNKISWNAPHRQQLELDPAQLLLVQNKEKDGFRLYSTQLALNINSIKAEPFNVYLKKKSKEVTGYISSVDMDVASKVLPLFVKDDELRNTISALSLSGMVEDIFLFNQSEHFIVDAGLSNIDTKYSGGIPGVNNVSGHLNFHNNKLTVELNSENGAIDLAQHFVLPIPYDKFSMKSEFSFNDKGWLLDVNEVALSSPELTLSGSLQVDAPTNSKASMGLLMGIVKGDASLAEHYYPLTLMSESLFNYLDEALVEGDLTRATVLFNGPLSNFPFKDDSGVFVVDVEIEKGIFQFADGWAPITDFTANLNFTNEGMLITGRGGQLANLSTKGVEVEIADLAGAQVLTVDALIHPIVANEITKLLQLSPYKDSVGAVLEALSVGGEVNGEFHLNLPLNNIDQAIAQGSVNFKDNTIALQAPRVDFDRLNGKLVFVNDKITTDNLFLHYADLPLKLDVNGMNKPNYYYTNINFGAQWQSKEWLTKVPKELKNYAQGKFDWQGDLTLHQHKNGGFSYNVDINSNLKGIQLDLPTPYGKLASSTVPFSISGRGGLKKSTFDFKVGEQLNFFGELKHSTTSFSKAHLVLGDDAMLLPMDGFHITSKLDEANIDQWFPLINNIIKSVSGDSSPQAERALSQVDNADLPLLPTPERVRGSVSKLSILGQTFHNASFNLLDKSDWWLLQLNAKETRSRIKIYPDSKVQGIEINADFIELANNSEVDLAVSESTKKSAKDIKSESIAKVESVNVELTKSELKTTFDNIPKIKFNCDRCQIGELRLGNVSFDIERENDNNLLLNNFTAKRKDAALTMAGRWALENGNSNTSVTGHVSINSIEHELNALDFASIIRDSGIKLNFDLQWNDAPSEFSMAHLNGELNGVVDDGYLAQVPDTARIFSVLSLESLLRKLTLDFRDIFSDGMFYSSIKGNFKLEEGVLHTENTKLNGTAGDLVLIGSTDLNKGYLDYNMTYKPNLTSSLPVLAWIATSLNPATFLAGIALDQIITANVVSEFNFELKGPVGDPQLTEVDRKSQNVSVDSSSDNSDVKLEEPGTDDASKGSTFKQGSGI